MPSRYNARFPERKITARESAKTATPGAAASAPAKVTERTAAWPKLARGGSNFNRSTRAPVVKVAAAKAGLP